MPAETQFTKDKKRILTMQREKLLTLVRLDVTAILIGYGIAKDFAQQLASELSQKLK